MRHSARKPPGTYWSRSRDEPATSHRGAHMNNELSHALWRKASYSGAGDNCVEMAHVRGPAGLPHLEAVGIRDSKSPENGALVLSPAAWARVADEIKTGRHDL
ncbi:DUF397 domain-containing protein [Actinomadura viridis]|uniref:DUF397 domain-containing protein n=1 Tax=Actinomadura viridis TaxID=58110 RepID=UPI0036A35FD8